MPKKPIATVQTTPITRLVDQAFRANSAHGFIYLNNQKVGCSTIKGSLWKVIDGIGPTREKGGVHNLESSPFNNRPREPEAARTAYVFTFVRNPFQRLVSAYLNKIVTQEDSTWSDFATRFNVPTDQTISFDGFVELLSGIPPEAFDPHWRRQQMNTLYPFVKPNLTGDLEQLNQLLPKVLTRVFGRPMSESDLLQGRRHRTKARVVWRDYLKDNSTLRRFLDIYNEDFAAFGYVPDLSAEPASQTLPKESEHAHDGLAMLVRYWAAPKAEKLGLLSDTAAADPDGVLSDWILSQRLIRLQKNPERLATVLNRQSTRIAQGPAYLRRIADEVKQKADGRAGPGRVFDEDQDIQAS